MKVTPIFQPGKNWIGWEVTEGGLVRTVFIGFFGWGVLFKKDIQASRSFLKQEGSPEPFSVHIYDQNMKLLGEKVWTTNSTDYRKMVRTGRIDNYLVRVTDDWRVDDLGRLSLHLVVYKPSEDVTNIDSRVKVFGAVDDFYASLQEVGEDGEFTVSTLKRRRK